MPVEKCLETLREGLESCDITAFGDLSSGLILRSNTATPCRREVLDALCNKASEGFSLQDKIDLPQGAGPSIFGCSLIEFGPEYVRVFARTPDAKTDVVCARLSTAGLNLETLELCRKSAQMIQDASE